MCIRDRYNPQVNKWLENVSDTPEDVGICNISNSDPVSLQDGERHPSSRPRTPDDGKYDIVKSEHMNSRGDYVEDDGNWISAAGLKTLRKNMKQEMPWNHGRAARKKRDPNREGQWLDADALLQLEHAVLADKMGNPEWFKVKPMANDPQEEWARLIRTPSERTDEQGDFVASSGANDVELTWGDSRQVSSSVKERNLHGRTRTGTRSQARAIRPTMHGEQRRR